MDQIAEFQKFYNVKIHKLEKRISVLEGKKLVEEEKEEVPKPRLTPQQRLKICIIGQLLLLISVVVPTVLLANKESTYYRFGPNEDLIIISIKINTGFKYGILLLYVLLFRICKVFIGELGMPILTFNIYNPNQKRIEGFTRTELQVLANIMFMLNAISYALTLQLAIVQIDIAVLSGIFSELAAIPTIYLLLQDKEFESEEEKRERLLKVTEIYIKAKDETYFQM